MNIAAVIPTAPRNGELSATQLNIALRKVGRACWDEEKTAIDIEGVMLQAKATDTAATVERDTAAVHHASHTEATKTPTFGAVSFAIFKNLRLKRNLL